MVMEAPPSPQSVGREFVRQYYTLLNKAPTHLHRFYNNQSSFVHGGLDPPNRETSPMIGQKQIHQKIQQLNFRDCHAKITQVDSQATLGNGVVVQVTGELSNAGQPMRRFTQTFVLAAQSPKKYYVHNDIFRYQDEIISDEECDPETRSDPEDDLGQDRQVIGDVPQISPQQMPYYNPNTAPLQANMPPVPHHHGQPPPPPPHVLTQPIAAVNGAVHPEELTVLPAQVPPQHVPAGQAQGMGTPLSSIQPGLVAAPPLAPTTTLEESETQPMENITVEEPENNYTDGQDAEIKQPEAQQQEPVLSNEPKTYATLLKSGGTAGFANAVQTSGIMNQPPKATSPVQNRFDNRDPQSASQITNQTSNVGQRSNNNRNGNIRVNQQQRMPRQESRSGGPGRNSINDDNNFEDRKRTQGNSFGDSNQLFLGNLPHSATEDDLREIFIEFGQIVDLRIHSKPGNKSGPPGNRAPPNYGFITFETQQGVQNCLAAKPIFFPRNDPSGTQLNVEEKKTKDRPSYGGNRISTDNTGGNRPRDNGPRRGMGPGPNRNSGGNLGGGGGGTGNRPNTFNRGPSNRGPNTTYNNRR